MLLEMSIGTCLLLGAVGFIALICFLISLSASEQWEETKKFFAPVVAIVLIIGVIWAIIEASN